MAQELAAQRAAAELSSLSAEEEHAAAAAKAAERLGEAERRAQLSDTSAEARSGALIDEMDSLRSALLAAESRAHAAEQREEEAKAAAARELSARKKVEEGLEHAQMVIEELKAAADAASRDGDR